jgi:hypothetical protein
MASVYLVGSADHLVASADHVVASADQLVARYICRPEEIARGCPHVHASLPEISMIVPTRFETAIVGVRPDGALSIALLAPLPAPHAAVATCVALLECSTETALAMCAAVPGSLGRDAAK